MEDMNQENEKQPSIDQIMANQAELDKTKKSPGWKNALEYILGRFDEEGYGFLVSHEELEFWLDIGPEPPLTVDSKKWGMEKLNNVSPLIRCLRDEHNICLLSVQSEGYVVLTPDDQVEKGVDHHLKKARKALANATATAVNVDVDNLSDQGKAIQMRNILKIGHVRAAFNKRKFELPDVPKIANDKKDDKKE